MKKIIYILLFLSPIITSAQCMLPYLFKIDDDKNVRIQIHNISNIMNRSVLNFKSYSELRSWASSSKLKDVKCNMDSLGFYTKRNINYYIGTQHKRDSLRKKIDSIHKYYKKTFNYFENKAKYHVNLLNKNEEKIIELLKKNGKKHDSVALIKIKDRVNRNFLEIKNLAANIVITKNLKRENNESNDICEFIKYDLTLVEMYRQYFKNLHGKNLTNYDLPLILSLVFNYTKPKLPSILKENNIPITQEELNQAFSLEKKRNQFKNWQIEASKNNMVIFDKNNHKNSIDIALLFNQKGNPKYLLSFGSINKKETFLAWKIKNNQLVKTDFKSLFNTKEYSKIINEEYTTEYKRKYTQFIFELKKPKAIEHQLIDEYRYFWNGEKFMLCE